MLRWQGFIDYLHYEIMLGVFAALRKYDAYTTQVRLLHSLKFGVIITITTKSTSLNVSKRSLLHNQFQFESNPKDFIIYERRFSPALLTAPIFRKTRRFYEEELFISENRK